LTVDAPARVDVIIVSFNSRDSLRQCVDPLAGHPGINVIVVDNASPDGSLAALEGLPVTSVQAGRNGGFGSGCNIGWRLGSAPNTLFLNPDATISAAAVLALADVLESDPGLGAVGPRIVNVDGSLDFSQRRFPRLRSTFATAVFLHRLLPRAAWTDEMVRDPQRYERAGDAEWISGACLMVRRAVLERINGFDEGFFLYLEDTDICRRIWDAGARVGYSPDAVCIHVGGSSAPRSSLAPVHVASKMRYTEKHAGRLVGAVERAGLVLWAAVRIVMSRGGISARAGYLRALPRLLHPRPRLTP
jgi:GT2 family glycosyltransferase